jgi:hypothetical protein
MLLLDPGNETAPAVTPLVEMANLA